MYKLIFTLIFLFAQAVSAGDLITGYVTSVHDGDTFTMQTDEGKKIHVRLAQIDAPEMPNSLGGQSKSAQTYGNESRASLDGMIYNKNVTVDVSVDPKTGVSVITYGRPVGTVYVNGLNVNYEQVRLGMAWAYRKYATDPEVIRLEDAARKSGIGLWSDPNRLAPWDFRHN